MKTKPLNTNECEAFAYPSIYNRFKHAPRAALSFPGQGRTKQAFKDECNINNILSRYQRTGLLEAVNRIQPQYGDVTGLEYQAAMFAVNNTQALFAELPSSIRKRFENNPFSFISFVNDPANEQECLNLGLKVPRPGLATVGQGAPLPQGDKPAQTAPQAV